MSICLKKFALSALLTIWLGMYCSGESRAGDHASNRVSSAITTSLQFHHELRNLPSQSNTLGNRHELYLSMADTMELPEDFEYLEVPEEVEQEPWFTSAEVVEEGIRPGVSYEVVKSRGSAHIRGTEEVTERLRNNLRFITWYRSQLNQPFGKERADQAADSMAGLIDGFLEKLSESVPEVRIRATGDVINDEERIEYSDQEIWAIMSTINRYFFYKFQLNPGREDFQKADFLLVESMVKTAAIYGSKPPETGLQKIEVELSENDRNWKQHGFEAMETWEDFESAEETGICVISVPARPAPTQVEQAREEPAEEDSNEFPSDVEDIREIGDRIFIKRRGRWQPWDG
ncbi:MAG: hypothetical protein AAF456_24600 [Planctomycetota bacterium]